MLSFMEDRPMLRFVLVASTISALWILLSDRIVARLFPGMEENLWAQSIKGLLFVLVLGSLVYVMLQREFVRAQEAYRTLKISEDRLMRAEQASFVMTCHVGLDGRWLRVPPALCSLLGVAEESLLEKTIQDFCLPGDRDDLRRDFERLVKGEAASFEREIECHGGADEPVWFYLNASIVRDEADRPLHFIVYLRDVTARKQAEMERERLAEILEATPDFVGTTTPDGQTLYINRAGRAMVEKPGRPAESMKPADFHPDWALKIVREEGLPTAMEQGSWQGETALLDRNGREIPVSQVILSHRSATGKLLFLSTILRDLTESKQSERALRESEARLHLAVSAAKIGLWDWDTRSTHVYFSPEWKLQLGYADHEIANELEEWRSRVHPDDLEAAQARIQRYLEKPWPNYFNEFRMKHRDGSYRWILASADLLPDREGNLTRMVGAHVDITEQKLEEERILSIARAVSGVPGAEFFPSFVQHVARAFDATCAFVGVLDDELGQKVRTIAVWREEGSDENFEYRLQGTPCENVLSGELCVYETKVAAAFPRDTILREQNIEAYAGVPLENSAGEPSGILVVLYDRPLEHGKIVESMLRIFATRASGELQRSHDLEVQKQLEAQMRHTQKLESLGVLAGGIAHDFNNLLLTIMGNTSLAQLEADSSPKLTPLLNDIEKAAQRAAELCGQLLAYSGKGKFVVSSMNLNELVRELSQLLKVSISRKAEIDLELAPALPLIEGDPTQIRQVLMNLIINASDALENQAGGIVIRTSARYCLREFLDEHLDGRDLPEGRYVVLEVEDTGCGMTPETLERIFDPFFTTKFTGRGLGMAAVLGIMRGHHGVIGVESQPGRGTRFEILFPAVEGTNKSAVTEKPPTEANRAGEGLILVADDEATVRDFTSRVLERAGYRVITANDGREAVEQVRSRADELVLVLLDLTMPRLSGAEAGLEIRALRPKLPLLLTSGYSEEEVGAQLPDIEPASFIQKPYRTADLIDEVRLLVDRPEVR